ncbi:MAG TPA: oxidoreductase [Bryobacteraceae bacterium]
MLHVSILFLIITLPLAAANNIRLGVIGTDTSHAVEFTHILNDPGAPGHISGAHVVAAWKGGSPDVKESARNVNRYAEEMREKWGVKIVGSISDLCPMVDGLLLESLDGRKHLRQFRQAMACGKPMFIDKPLSDSLSGARAIASLAQEHHIPWFSASALRFGSTARMRTSAMISAIVWAPGPTEPHQQLKLTWYGIHGLAMLYTLFGTGCVAVSEISSGDSDVITGRWKDGRLGTLHLQRPYGKWGAIVFLKNNKLRADTNISFSYVPLVRQIVDFMSTKVPPVPNNETLEMFEFMDAAQRSVAEHGALVKLN